MVFYNTILLYMIVTGRGQPGHYEIPSNTNMTEVPDWLLDLLH